MLLQIELHFLFLSCYDSSFLWSPWCRGWGSFSLIVLPTLTHSFSLSGLSPSKSQHHIYNLARGREGIPYFPWKHNLKDIQITPVICITGVMGLLKPHWPELYLGRWESVIISGRAMYPHKIWGCVTKGGREEWMLEDSSLLSHYFST